MITTQDTLKAAILGALWLLAGCLLASLGLYGWAALCGVTGAAIPGGVLVVRLVDYINR